MVNIEKQRSRKFDMKINNYSTIVGTASDKELAFHQQTIFASFVYIKLHFENEI